MILGDFFTQRYRLLSSVWIELHRGIIQKQGGLYIAIEKIE